LFEITKNDIFKRIELICFTSWER